jgi:hypothetical protein
MRNFFFTFPPEAVEKLADDVAPVAPVPALTTELSLAVDARAYTEPSSSLSR